MDFALTLIFWLNTLFAAWVVFRNGADWLHRTLPRNLLTDRRGAPWSVQRLRAFVGVMWSINAWSLWVALDA